MPLKTSKVTLGDKEVTVKELTLGKLKKIMPSLTKFQTGVGQESFEALTPVIDALLVNEDEGVTREYIEENASLEQVKEAIFAVAALTGLKFVPAGTPGEAQAGAPTSTSSTQG